MIYASFGLGPPVPSSDNAYVPCVVGEAGQVFYLISSEVQSPPAIHTRDATY